MLKNATFKGASVNEVLYILSHWYMYIQDAYVMFTDMYKFQEKKSPV